MINFILDKTDKGREEIATRKYQVPSRLRALLVLIDGKHDTEDLLKKVAGLGLNEQSVTELLDNGFIHALEIGEETPSTPPAMAGHAAPRNEGARQNPSTPVANTAAGGEKQFLALYNFYTETIKSSIGLRGYGLQLKVERASSVQEFRKLREPYLEAVLKAKGKEMAHSLGVRLDELLNGG
jgi:hypothetical protein